MSKRPLSLLVAVFAAALVAAGCGDDDDNTTTTTGQTQTQTETTPAEEAPAESGEGVESGSAELRAALTGLLEEHVYLAGIAVVNGVDNGLDSPQFEAAAGTLDKNSIGLSEAIGSVYGDDAGEQFLELWRAHIGMFVDYTKGKATKDAALAKKAQADLDGYREDFGAFLASANPNLTEEAVADELTPHVASLSKAIDSVVAGKANAFERLRKASDHMPNTAKVLSGAIAQQFPDKFSGTVDAGASELRAALTSLLSEHVYLAGVAVSMGVDNGLDSPQFEAAAGTLDKNSIGLSEAIGSVYGDDAGEQFLELWRAHIGMFVDYTKGKATKDAALAKKAQADLDGYREDFGAFLASANPNLTEEAVADELTPHVASLSKAIDSVVAGKANAFDRLMKAASHMPNTAKVLSGAIATQFPDKFPG